MLERDQKCNMILTRERTSLVLAPPPLPATALPGLCVVFLPGTSPQLLGSSTSWIPDGPLTRSPRLGQQSLLFLHWDFLSSTSASRPSPPLQNAGAVPALLQKCMNNIFLCPCPQYYFSIIPNARTFGTDYLKCKFKEVSFQFLAWSTTAS